MSWKVLDIKDGKAQRKAVWSRVLEYSGHPELVAWTAELIKAGDIPERNDLALATAVQKYSQKYIKFFREYPERFNSPLRTIFWGLGDCDDKSIFIASVLRSFRIPVKLKFIQFKHVKPDGTVKDVNHVYPVAYIDGKWLAMESVHEWPIGDDPAVRAIKKGFKVQIDTIGDKAV